MAFDTGRPFQSIGVNRNETLVVFFDGFIKNTTEGMIRTMLTDKKRWLSRYPDLEYFDGKEEQDLYNETMFYQPKDMLESISNGKVTETEIDEDISEILPRVVLKDSQMTTFEVALYKLIQVGFIQKCYIYREGEFYSNELTYCRTRYANYIEKFEFVDQVNLPDFLVKVHPTTIFINDPNFVFDYVVNHMTDDERLAQIYIILANFQMIQFNEEKNEFEYNKDLVDSIFAIGEDAVYGVSPMFNFQIEDVASTNTEEIKIEEEES